MAVMETLINEIVSKNIVNPLQKRLIIEWNKLGNWIDNIKELVKTEIDDSELTDELKCYRKLIVGPMIGYLIMYRGVVNREIGLDKNQKEYYTNTSLDNEYTNKTTIGLVIDDMLDYYTNAFNSEVKFSMRLRFEEMIRVLKENKGRLYV